METDGATGNTIHHYHANIHKALKGSGSRSQNLKYRSGAKTHAGIRSFPLPPEVAEFHAQQKSRQEENRRLAGSSYNTVWSEFICVDAIGEPIKPEYLSRAFRLFLKKHGLRHIRFHELRDFNTSLLLDKGIDMKRIQSWLGNSMSDKENRCTRQIKPYTAVCCLAAK